MSSPPAALTAVLADDDPQVLDLVRTLLENEGFRVRAAVNGSEALVEIKKLPPDVVVLDLQMPGRDGFDVCRELRQDPILGHLPVIILSAAGTRDNKIDGLNLGVDDFITKPIDRLEFLARIKMIMRRSRQGLDANPLTRLPGNVAIQNRIEKALAENKPLAVLYLDLNEFKAYNDKYGYEAGDRVLRATAFLVVDVTRDIDPTAFVGHVGGDDFIVLSEPARMEGLARRIAEDFDVVAPSFYGEDDRRRGKIVSTDRQGRTREFPFVSIAIGVCHNQLRPLTSYPHVSQLGAELKKGAKSRPGSQWMIDRRRE